MVNQAAFFSLFFKKVAGTAFADHLKQFALIQNVNTAQHMHPPLKKGRWPGRGGGAGQNNRAGMASGDQQVIQAALNQRRAGDDDHIDLSNRLDRQFWRTPESRCVRLECLLDSR